MSHPYPKLCPFCKTAKLKFPPVSFGRWQTDRFRTGTYTCGSGVFDLDDRSGIDHCANFGTQPNGRKTGVIRLHVY